MDDGLRGKKFLRVKNLAHRWDCGTARIYDLASKGVLRLWHPEGKSGCKGVLVDVQSILAAEKAGYIKYGLENKAVQAGGGDPQPEPNHNIPN